MTSDDIKRILSEVYPVSHKESDARKLSTAAGTFEVFAPSGKNLKGVIKGNRLNSGKLRSQLMFFPDEKMWSEGESEARKTLRADQRAFVQVGSDEWDVYVGKSMDGRSEPEVWRHVTGLESFLSDLSNLALTKGAEQLKSKSLQRIVYGAPGTGKSFGTDGDLVDESGNEKAISFRTTFHPDSDYATFVGAYKPIMKRPQRVVYVNDGKTAQLVEGPDELKYEEKISYAFRPQAFMNAYVAAWREMSKGLKGKPVVLVIEEINRGNCAQIFGDIFQLLDRDDATGWSSYPIDADTDLANWLKAVREKKADDTDGDLIFGAKLDAIAKPTKIKDSDWADIKKGKKLALPPNLYIWATMNTSDQSLFPIDSAFKRRWEWKYVPIREGKYKDGEKKGQKLSWKIKFTIPAHQDGNGQQVAAKNYIYDWWKFLLCINKKIYKTTESEDKKLGYFFLKPDGEDATTHDGTISSKRFVGKVIFYLWNDVFKDYGIENLLKNEDIGKKDDDEKGQGVAFEEFFSEDSDEVNPQVLVAFFKAIGLEPESGRPAEGGEVVASESETGTAVSEIADAHIEEQLPTE